MKIEIDNGGVIVAGMMATALVLISIIVATTYYSTLALKNGYNEVQEQGYQATMWVKPSKP
jgi:hypothetical protein